MGKKVVVEKLHCKRCHHEWWPEVDPTADKVKEPKNCPRCKSPYWNRPVIRKSVSEARKK
ncbi:MAG: hypothetical protein QXE82_00215 [Candidatus Nitrosotenuis sp.]